MRMRTIWGVVLASVFGATSAGAQATIGLAWSDCPSGGGSSIATFTCASNTGQNMLVPSFTPPYGVTALAGVAVTLQVCGGITGLPAWWSFSSPGACRQGSMTWSAPVETGCGDPWTGLGVAGGITSYTNLNPVLAQWVAESHTADGSGVAVDAQTEYQAMRLTIDHANTTGAGACAGCITPVALRVARVDLVMADGSPTVSLTNSSGSSIAFWNGVASQCYVVPARNQTWGAIKSLYR